MGNFPVFFIVGSKELCINVIANHFTVGLMRQRTIKKGYF